MKSFPKPVAAESIPEAEPQTAYEKNLSLLLVQESEYLKKIAKAAESERFDDLMILNDMYLGAVAKREQYEKFGLSAAFGCGGIYEYEWTNKEAEEQLKNCKKIENVYFDTLTTKELNALGLYELSASVYTDCLCELQNMISLMAYGISSGEAKGMAKFGLINRWKQLAAICNDAVGETIYDLKYFG